MTYSLIDVLAFSAIGNLWRKIADDIVADGNDFFLVYFVFGVIFLLQVLWYGKLEQGPKKT